MIAVLHGICQLEMNMEKKTQAVVITEVLQAALQPMSFAEV